jgi:hypothetical protein
MIALLVLLASIHVGFPRYFRWRQEFAAVGYSLEHWRGKRFETFMHILFSILWLYLTAVFLVASGIFW